MRKPWWIVAVAALTVWPIAGNAENLSQQIKKAAERSTLDQPGTKPFHLKATLAPSFERDKDSGRTGEVEIWWASPAQWRRELRSPQFHQIEIADGAHRWQKNEGDYFPEWLRETAIELIKPIPPLEQVLEQAKTADVRRIGQMINLSWTTASGTVEVPNILRSWVALQNDSGLLLYAGGLGWGGEFKDYASFHGRMIARTVHVGSPQVTAKVITLEELKDVAAGFFDAAAKGNDDQPLQTLPIAEISLRKNLLPSAPPAWPPLQDGPLEGKVSTKVVIDREGKAREIGPVVSDNPALNEAARQLFAAMRFNPFLLNGVSVQVISQVTVPFKTVRPSGTESFESARTYFERGRQVGFPAAGSGTPYTLRAEFTTKGRDGIVANGRYEDTWLSEAQWRREAWFGKSHCVRSRNGETSYQLAEGDDVILLQFVLRALEPIPAIDTFVESDWKIKRDTVSGVQTVRVLSGYENPQGELDPEQASAFWFDEAGLLRKSYFGGLAMWRAEFEEFAGVKIARKIDVFRNQKPLMHIRITEVLPAGKVPPDTFVVAGHEWVRSFTAEVR
jgi:hypothetical protein